MFAYGIPQGRGMCTGKNVDVSQFPKKKFTNKTERRKSSTPQKGARNRATTHMRQTRTLLPLPRRPNRLPYTGKPQLLPGPTLGAQ